ncbi:hypothetical protein MPOCJGCO_1307 [Methylobacterium trifolii]|uniref:Uncharacterized protein n=2 Tax=Methylobacterium trifolii TaxID=1003092 RepID=A0ABQ4TVB0_9HYPH|nr:hypothetical protein MPOCJGCO_1307 [Methylobacterium trifolii]
MVQDRSENTAGLDAYEFAVFEAMFKTYGNAEAAKRNRDEVARMFREGAPAQVTAEMIHETQVDHDEWVNEAPAAEA